MQDKVKCEYKLNPTEDFFQKKVLFFIIVVSECGDIPVQVAGDDADQHDEVLKIHIKPVILLKYESMHKISVTFVQFKVFYFNNGNSPFMFFIMPWFYTKL